jgi:hypothetical protein
MEAGWHSYQSAIATPSAKPVKTLFNAEKRIWNSDGRLNLIAVSRYV